MATNTYFQSGIPGGRSSEQHLIEDLVIESLRIYGHDVYYMPRKTIAYDSILTEDPDSVFASAYPLEMYLEEVNGFAGENDLLTKFGVEFRDQATFVVSKRRWIEQVGMSGDAVLTNRPAEGDLLYFALTKSFFEIKRVEHADPFYQLGKLYVFKLQCELYQFSSERFDTSVPEIDDVNTVYNQEISNYEFKLETGDLFILEHAVKSKLILESYKIESLDSMAQNESFDTSVLDILDFSVRNPFGEIVER